MTRLDPARLPRHVAIIMDGNGRWATERALARHEGHRQGAEAVRRVVRASRRLGVPALTLYAFSAQNWLRPKAEVDALMTLLCEFLRGELPELCEREICLRAIGRLDALPDAARTALAEVTERTGALTGMTLTLALSYGGQEELADAARGLASRVARGELAADAIDETLLGRALPSMAVGPVDLLIRTGGELRVSNFLLWGAAYAELHFSPKLWPDFDEEDLLVAVADYQQRDRRFGRAPAEAADPPGDPPFARTGPHA